eukprot:SM000028S10092  [mRNA]  locus=s28:289403:290148:- [translate_table: standard]
MTSEALAMAGNLWGDTSSGVLNALPDFSSAIYLITAGCGLLSHARWAYPVYFLSSGMLIRAALEAAVAAAARGSRIVVALLCCVLAAAVLLFELSSQSGEPASFAEPERFRETSKNN